ncbi:hypothetical protein CTAYLR_005441 [Chrysophaeum taylorii]|uniref:Uncharacterized protein n=1 Tax=Chrysophaeum taylorii TaxID=2483200 RepID=A0AAD7XSF4_9STRA|nr:hypothetical protein CTAYLR_005441 [Chrysophaeum taylorii]
MRCDAMLASTSTARISDVDDRLIARPTVAIPQQKICRYMQHAALSRSLKVFFAYGFYGDAHTGDAVDDVILKRTPGFNLAMFGSAAFVAAFASCVAGMRAPQPIPKGTPLERYPAKSLCSRCGLCDSSYIGKVKEACAFLGEGWGRTSQLEAATHGRQRNLDDETELYFGVTQALQLAKVRAERRPRDAGWTGIVTSIAAAALERGVVDAVIGVGRAGTGPYERMEPAPVLCRTPAEVLGRCPGVKPVLAPSLELLDQVARDNSIRRLLFLGVGCQVQAARALDLNLEELYVLGTNCADNVRSPDALKKFLRAVSQSPETAIGFEFMQDYTVHVKHVDGKRYERVPVFSLPSEQLKDVIAVSCYSCFDYVNSLADLVVGYMAAPDEGVQMTQHSQYYVVRNDRGRRLLELIADDLEVNELSRANDGASRIGFAKQVTEQDLETLFLGAKPKIWALPDWVARLAAKLLSLTGPSGLEFAKNSIDYHQLRNAIHLRVTTPQSAGIIPEHARRIEALHYPGFTDTLVKRYLTALETTHGPSTG